MEYTAWKRSMGRYDEGDVWREALDRLRTQEGSVEREEEHCDILIVDEAQRYPADSLFEVFLLWYRPSRCILVGMDTKQAITLGTTIHLTPWK